MKLESNSIPRLGMYATVRNRRGVIAAVEPYENSEDGKLLHLVTVEFSDPDGEPEETLLWERELCPFVNEPNALPDVHSKPPMIEKEFRALLRATRWSALSPFLDPKDVNCVSKTRPLSPLTGAIKIEDYQLVPLMRAMEMPRISLFIADDVGLGKTIEAGLILAELIRVRRIRKVLIITPASLRFQWKQELEEKFSIYFDIIDREATFNLRKELGLDTNPWRAKARIITSYHYLRQPDVLEQFKSFCQIKKSTPKAARLPWDLLIVDEAHNLMPSISGENSDLCNMLSEIAPHFEHRIFFRDLE